MDLRDVIGTRRKVLGISQQDLAEMSGVSLPTIKDIERGVANPSLSTISKLLDVLGLEIQYHVRQTVSGY